MKRLLFRIMTGIHGLIPESLFHFQAHHLVACELRFSSKPIHPEVRLATLDDLNLLIEFEVMNGFRLRRSELIEWFRRGARAWIIEREGRLIACYWLHRNDSYHLYDWLVLKASPEDIWVLGWWVSPKHRGRGLAAEISRPGASEYSCAGFHRTLGAIDALNQSSLRASQKRGCKILGRVFVVRFIGITLVQFGRTLRMGRWNPDHALELAVNIGGSKVLRRVAN